MKHIHYPAIRLLAAMLITVSVIVLSRLAAQAPAALASYRARGLVLAHRIPIEGWMTLVLACPVRSPATRLPCGGSIAGLVSAP